MLRTSTPGAACCTAGAAEEVARVKISTSTPRRASSTAVCRTYTFIPPASPVPGCASGEVWTEITATRCGRLGWDVPPPYRPAADLRVSPPPPSRCERTLRPPTRLGG